MYFRAEAMPLFKAAIPQTLLAKSERRTAKKNSGERRPAKS
jgi:hypothetical protein